MGFFCVPRARGKKILRWESILKNTRAENDPTKPPKTPIYKRLASYDVRVRQARAGEENRSPNSITSKLKRCPSQTFLLRRLAALESRSSKMLSKRTQTHPNNLFTGTLRRSVSSLYDLVGNPACRRRRATGSPGSAIGMQSWGQFDAALWQSDGVERRACFLVVRRRSACCIGSSKYLWHSVAAKITPIKTRNFPA